MSRLIIDAEELIMALESHDPESQYFLDIHTGEVVFVGDEADVGPDDEFQAQFDENPDRFRNIDPILSSESWQTMADFIEQMPDCDAAEKLTNAIRHSHPFRRFKAALLYYPNIREEWFAFHEKAMLDHAQRWLDEEEIEAELKTRNVSTV